MKSLAILTIVSLLLSIGTILYLSKQKTPVIDYAIKFKVYKDSVNKLLADQDSSIFKLKNEIVELKDKRIEVNKESSKIIKEVGELTRMEAFEYFVDRVR